MMLPPTLSGVAPSHAPRWSDARQARRQIDRAVSRALFDPAFAAQLLAEPTLAVEQAMCEQTQYVAVREIQAHDLHDFACQISNQFWAVRTIRPLAS